MNTTYVTSIKNTPYEIVFGQKTNGAWRLNNTGTFLHAEDVSDVIEPSDTDESVYSDGQELAGMEASDNTGEPARDETNAQDAGDIDMVQRAVKVKTAAKRKGRCEEELSHITKKPRTP